MKEIMRINSDPEVLWYLQKLIRNPLDFTYAIEADIRKVNIITGPLGFQGSEELVIAIVTTISVELVKEIIKAIMTKIFESTREKKFERTTINVYIENKEIAKNQSININLGRMTPNISEYLEE